MKTVECPRDEAVRRAAGREELDAELEAHIRSCSSCRETLRVAGFLRRAAADEGRPRLPTPAQLWWRARVVRRLTEPDPRVQRVTRPVVWGLGLGTVGALLALLAAVTLVLSRLNVVLSDLGLPLELVSITAFLGAVSFPAAVLVVLLLLLRESA